MLASVLEGDPRAGNQVLDRAGHQDLAGAGLGGDPRPDMHGDAADVLAHPFALASVQPGPDLQAQAADTSADRLSDKITREKEARRRRNPA